MHVKFLVNLAEYENLDEILLSQVGNIIDYYDDEDKCKVYTIDEIKSLDSNYLESDIYAYADSGILQMYPSANFIIKKMNSSNKTNRVLIVDCHM